VPFEFYETVDVKTGGFQAQYGKAIGGFVTATTKRGSNEFKTKVTMSVSPDSLRDKQPDTYASANQLNTSDTKVATVSVSGPIIKDKLFYYVLAAPTLRESTSFGLETNTRDDFETDETFYGAKLDYYINDNNLLEVTYFSDEGQTVTDSFAWDAATQTTGNYNGPSFNDFGGKNLIVSFSVRMSLIEQSHHPQLIFLQYMIIETHVVSVIDQLLQISMSLLALMKESKET
jgi:outer membrane receptor for ferrienterochelin and colicin